MTTLTYPEFLTTAPANILKSCFIDCFKYPKSTMTDEEVELIKELWMWAGIVGRAKMLDGCTLSTLKDWQIISVKPVHWMQLDAEPAWNVTVQCNEQSLWTHITGTEILAWRREQAEIREKQIARENFLQVLSKYASSCTV
jgi:hypothetical protein